MFRKKDLLLVVITLFLACAKSGDQVVEWRPNQPKAGDRITIIFTPERLVQHNKTDLSIYLVYQLLQNNDTKTFRVPMNPKKDTWQASIKTDPGTFLLRLKFEDNLDRAEDNKGLGWSVVLKNETGNIPQNAHLNLGLIQSRVNQPGLIPNYALAMEEFQKELASNPDNYQAWYHIWEIQLKKSGNSSASLTAIQSELDSILTTTPESADLRFLAFQTCWKLLNNHQSAIQHGDSLLAKFSSFNNKEEVSYALLFLKNSNDPGRLDAELINYANQTNNPAYLKKIYYRLDYSLRQRQETAQAINFIEKYLELEPNDVHARLDLANIYLKARNYDPARRLIDEAKSNCKEENYLTTMPWNDPEQRRAFFNLDRCRILSTHATLETAQSNFSQALQYRRQVIDIGTNFPAFEWAKIGDLYFQSGKLDSAARAYIKAIAINPAQSDEINKLQAIYLQTGGNADNFYNYAKESVDAELRASAKTAPDFELMDLAGNLLRLSEQQGKIIVLTFWDSWSSASQEEIPRLNNLVDSFKNNPDVLFWAVSIEAPVSIKKSIKENPFQFHQFHSGYPVKKQYSIIGFPTHLVIDPHRKIRYSHVGYIPDVQKQLEQEIKQLLDESKQIS
ncbi:redoxin domain-containing protein [candidate division KSB1 bacterium]|nr:redoxin domain-containing protein [candidate division KSB1 bacterium]